MDYHSNILYILWKLKIQIVPPCIGNENRNGMAAARLSLNFPVNNIFQIVSYPLESCQILELIRAFVNKVFKCHSSISLKLQFRFFYSSLSQSHLNLLNLSFLSLNVFVTTVPLFIFCHSIHFPTELIWSSPHHIFFANSEKVFRTSRKMQERKTLA